MNFAQVKAITIPEGSAKQLAQGLTVLWRKASGASDLIVPVYNAVYPTYNDVARGFPWTLPTGFVQVEYISTAKTAAINTGIVTADTDTIYFTYQLDSGSLSQSGDKYMISQQAGYNGGGLWVETYGNTNTWYVRFGSSSSANTASTADERTGKHQVTLRKQVFKVDGTTRQTPNYSSMPDTPTTFGARVNSAGDAITGGGMYGNIYLGTGIVDGNQVARWWGVPVKRTGDGAGGMYDVVSGTVFMSVTGTDFGCGPEV